MTQFVNSASGTVLTTTSETAIVTSPLPDYRFPAGGGVAVYGEVAFGPAGAASTGIVLKIRQGAGTIGTVVGTPGTYSSAGTVGSTAFGCDIGVVDYNPAQPVGQYTLTATQVGAVGNGTVSTSFIQVTQPGGTP